MTLHTVIPKRINPASIIGNTPIFLFDSEKRSAKLLNGAIKDSNKCLETLIEVLESIDVNDIDAKDDYIENTLDFFNMMSNMLRTVLTPFKKLIGQSENEDVALAQKYRQLYYNNKEILDTLEKLIDRLHELKENKFSSIMQDIAIKSIDDLWSDSESDDLMELFLKSE